MIWMRRIWMACWASLRRRVLGYRELRGIQEGEANAKAAVA